MTNHFTSRDLIKELARMAGNLGGYCNPVAPGSVSLYLESFRLTWQQSTN